MHCWFCSVREAAPEHTWSTEMYGDVDTKKTTEQTQVFYNVRHIELPRCADCHSRHTLALAAAVAALIFLVVFAAALLVAFLALFAPWIWALAAGLSFGLLLGALAVRLVSLKGIYSIKHARRDHPEITEYLDKGYRFGFRPKGHIPKNDALLPDEEQKNN